LTQHKPRRDDREGCHPMIGILAHTIRDLILAAILQTENETKVLIDTFVLV